MDLVLVEAKELVERINGLKIEIRSKHPPPHFHVITSEFKASFSLDDCTLIKGHVDSKYEKKINYWFYKQNAKKKLVEVWNRTRPADCVVGKYVETNN